MVRTNLQWRGVRLETSCPHCGVALETQVHIFLKCSFARVFWSGTQIQLDPNLVEGDDFFGVLGSLWPLEIVEVYE